jgi:succinate dehydrogenase / fumarate reductase, cytochrome b subunit
MNWSQFFISAVGRKIVMALTGLFLISFLVVHVGLNSCIFNDLPIFNPDDNGSMFNRAAYFMGNSLIIRIMEIGLFAGIILHIIQGYMVEVRNRKMRNKGYQVSLGNRGSTWMSRSMAILGTLIFMYLVMHVSQFWWPSRISQDVPPVNYPDLGSQREMHNMFLLMYDTFQQGWVVILYLVGVGSLLFHLLHGFHAAFRSVGVHNKKYLTMLKGLGYGFSIIVCVLFALMPLSMYFNWVSPN